MRLGVVVAAMLSLWFSAPAAESGSDEGVEYQLLATSKTSTMEKELNEAAEVGYRFEGVMGGETSFGGNEIVSIVGRPSGATRGHFRYKLCATNKTGTMKREMNAAGDAGYMYRDQTIAETLFGGREVIVIMERADDTSRWQYELLATKKTSTMQKEMVQAAAAGYRFRGVTVAKTSFGGDEVVVIMERRR